MKETWRKVRGYEGLYLVSTYGRVYGVKRKKILAQIPGTQGHLWVGLWKDGKYKAKFVHRLVLEAFVGPCPVGMEGCHSPDRSPTNNRKDNLRWGTKKDNAAGRDKDGRTVKGERFWSAKMNPNKVQHLRSLYATGNYTMRKLSKLFQISPTTTRQIVRRLCWKSVL